MRRSLWRRALVVVLVCTSIVWWHGMFARDAESLDRNPQYTATPGFRGMYIDWIKPFFYFYHYTGLFPVTWLGAKDRLVENPRVAKLLVSPSKVPRPGLRNEHYAVVRKGDLGQLFLLYPDYWKHGKAADATARTFNRQAACVASLVLFAGLALCGRALLGMLLVLAIGSNPFQLVQLYVISNVWGYPMLVAAILLGLCAPLIFASRPRPWHVAVPLVAGIFLACVREVRTEPALLIGSVALCCLTAAGRWRRRAALVVALLVSFGATSQAWAIWWRGKMETAVQVVEAAGGRAFGGDWNLHHSLWHPLWFGLGDFGQDKGYFHRDQAAYRYAVPILNARYGKAYDYDGGYLLKNVDADGLRVKLEVVPEYQEVLREKVLGDIRGDPVWYLGVLLQRAGRIFQHALPVRLAVGADFVQVPFSAWLALPVLALLAVLRQWDQVKLLLFFTPTSLPPFLVHSLNGFTNPTSFHLAAFALVSCWLLCALLRLAGRAQATSRRGAPAS